MEKSVVSGCFLTCILDIQQPTRESTEQMATDHLGFSENVWPVYWEKSQCKHDSLLIHGAKGKAQEISQEIRIAANQSDL